MKKNNTFTKFTTCLVLILGLLVISNGHAQTCMGNQITLTLDNIVATENTIEYDVFLKNTGTSQLKFSSYSGNVLYSDNMLPIGATGTLEVVDQPSATDFPGIAPNTLSPYHQSSSKSLRWIFVPGITPSASAPLLATNVNYKFARFRFTSSIPWDLDTVASLAFNTIPTAGVTLNSVQVYCNQNFASTSITFITGQLILNIGGESGTEGATINFRLLSNVEMVGNSPMIAFPNPFGEGFKLKSDLNSTDVVTLKVYDMLGKVIEQRQVIASELSKQELGTSYQAGLYNVMVAQGNQQQTIRVIKK
ncbi:MAG: T9SS type A sorting domain-containing protein [Flavobacterium sp.]|nr:T9SS type A sorting domain-containing protein [Flavobacterium sp.]